MTVTNVGTVSVGVAIPGVASTKIQLDAVVAAELPAILIEIAKLTADIVAFQADLTSALSVSADVQAQLSAQLTTIAGLQAVIALGPAGIVAQLVAQVTAPTFLVGLSAAGTQLLASVQGSLSTALSVSAALSAKVAANTALVAEITARIADFQARLAAVQARLPTLQAAATFSLTLAAQLANAGVTVLLYQGTLSGMNGADFVSAVGGAISSSATVWAPVLVTNVPATWAALQSFLKTS